MSNAWSRFASTGTNKISNNGNNINASPTKTANSKQNEVIDLCSPPTSVHSSPTKVHSSPTKPPSDPIKCPFGCINNFESSDALIRHINRLHPEKNGKNNKGKGVIGKGKNTKRGTKNEQENCCVF